FHWGKISDLTPRKLVGMYPVAINKWIESRNELLRPEILEVFSSQLLSDWGLDTVILKPA
ncbi:MAG: hypothetical protein WKF89_19360, partial [Chitinophagaceae bacterium]